MEAWSPFAASRSTASPAFGAAVGEGLSRLSGMREAEIIESIAA